MREIYTWADKVYVWLGPGENGSDRAMSWLRERAEIMRPLQLALATAKDKRTEKEEVSNYQDTSLAWGYDSERRVGMTRMQTFEESSPNVKCDVKKQSFS